MHKFAFLLLPLMLLTSCKAPASQTTETENPDQYYQPKKSNLPGTDGKGNSKSSKISHGDPLSPFNKDGSLKPQFPEGVLPKLNDIVRSSKAAIDKYDEIREGVEQSIEKAKAAPGDKALAAKAAAGVAEVTALHTQAKAAQDSLSVEGQKLLDSAQYYDQVVFSGMAYFVTNVEREFTNDLEKMNKALGK
jgi:hypothetical protein